LTGLCYYVSKLAVNLFVLLMCGGKQTRMGSYEGAKQLVPVNGEPNVDRTVRMLREVNRVIVRVVAPPTPDWIMFASDARAERVDSVDPLFLAAVAGALPLESHAIDRYLVLCGDVVFSPTILTKLIDPSVPITFAGRFSPNIHTGRPAGELYGFSFSASKRGLVVHQLEIVLAEVETLKETLHRGGVDDPDRIADIVEKNARLWRFMHMAEDNLGATVVDVDLWDYIDDIDGPDDLERLPRIEAAIRRRE